MVHTLRAASCIAAVLVVVAACSKPEGNSAAPAPPPPTPASTATTNAATDNGTGGPGDTQAELIFKSRCSTCHGLDGKGTGPAAITLNPKPRNYTDATWQKSVTDDHIREIIVKGGAAVGKSALMPPNPDLADKPAVVDALMRKVRSFATGNAAAAAK